MKLPELLEDYCIFCNVRSDFNKRNVIDLQDFNFFKPTTLLPLLALIEEHKAYENILYPNNSDIRNYLSIIIKRGLGNSNNKSYIPFVELPRDENQCSIILERIYNLAGDLGGENALHYVVSELVDNIYQHSGFSKSYILAQKYTIRGYTDVSFFDNGKTIAGSFSEKGIKYSDKEHHIAIENAIRGLSSKINSAGRGYGLRSSIRIYTEYGGTFLIVSGNGAVYVDKNYLKGYLKGYILNKEFGLKGTLITLRIPTIQEKIDIYKYISV